MAYNPPIFSKTSAVGVNSYTLTTPSGALWTGNNFAGAGELNDFAYVGVNLQTDESGSLTFQFSQDGTNWSSYPTTPSQIISGINEVHTAWKGGRYVRPVYSGSDGSKTYFRLQTYYSNHPLPLSAPLNQSIGDDQDATIVRAVTTGQTPNGAYSNTQQIGYAFSTTTPLSGSEVFQSDWIQIEGYQQVQTSIESDVDGTMTFEFAEDSAGTDIHRTLTIPYLASTGFQLLSAPCFTKYVRYTYTNGSTPQTDFVYDTKLLIGALSGQVLPLNSVVASGMVANLGRNVIVGQDASGNFRNSTVDEHGDLKTHIHEPTTAFGELMVANMSPAIQITFPNNINTELVNLVSSSATATFTHSNQMANINTGTTANVSASLSSKRRAKYRAGQGIDVRFTALFTTGSSAGTEQLAGIGAIENGQPVDGYFFGMSGSAFGIWTYNNGTGTFISSSAFNTDRFDGSLGFFNPSGVNISPEKGNVYGIKYQWLGYGAIKFYIEDPVEGFYSEAHLIQYANNNVVPSSINPTFPITYYVTNGGNAENVGIKTASGAAFIGGPNKITGPTQATGSIVAAAGGTVLLFALEGALVFPSGSSNTNRVSSYLRSLSVGNEGSNNTVVSIELRENTTITSPVYNYIGEATSPIRAINGSYSAGTGKRLNKWFIPRGTSITVDLTEYEYEISPGNNLTFILGGDASTETDVSITWVDDF